MANPQAAATKDTATKATANGGTKAPDLFGDRRTQAVDRAIVTTECEEKIIGVAYMVDSMDVGSGDKQRAEDSLVIRLAYPMKAKRDDEMVVVGKGEDVEVIAGWSLKPIAQAVRTQGPQVVEIQKTGQKKSPSNKERTLNIYDKAFMSMELSPAHEFLTPELKKELLTANRNAHPRMATLSQNGDAGL